MSDTVKVYFSTIHLGLWWVLRKKLASNRYTKNSHFCCLFLPNDFYLPFYRTCFDPKNDQFPEVRRGSHETPCFDPPGSCTAGHLIADDMINS